MSAVHEGHAHLAARAYATVHVVYVKAASTAVLQTDAREALSPRSQKHPSQSPPVPRSDAINTASVPEYLLMMTINPR